MDAAPVTILVVRAAAAAPLTPKISAPSSAATAVIGAAKPLSFCCSAATRCKAKRLGKTLVTLIMLASAQAFSAAVGGR